MPKYLVDLCLDGYESEKERKEACDEFLHDQLDFSASSVHYEHLTELEDNPTIKQLADLWNKCRAFVKENQVSCPESIYQVDSVNLACPEFVAEICECVGFEYCREEEEDEDGEGCETGDGSMS